MSQTPNYHFRVTIKNRVTMRAYGTLSIFIDSDSANDF
jgi:hypothetical protein